MGTVMLIFRLLEIGFETCLYLHGRHSLDCGNIPRTFLPVRAVPEIILAFGLSAAWNIVLFKKPSVQLVDSIFVTMSFQFLDTKQRSKYRAVCICTTQYTGRIPLPVKLGSAPVFNKVSIKCSIWRFLWSINLKIC